MQYFEQRNLTRGSRSGLDRAIAMFQRALELDPKYALAQAQLAYCYTWIALFNDPSNTFWWEHAKQALEKARSIDPNLAELHVVRYEQLWSRYEGFQIEAAVRKLQEAQRLNPAVGHDALGILYAHMGLEEPAVRETQRAIEIDPTSEIAQSRFREIYDLFYRPEKAIEVRALYPNPAGTPSYIRKSYLWKGMFSEARREADELLAQNPQDSVGLSAKALIFALQGDLGAARKAIPVMDEDSRNSRAYHHSTYNIACIYAVLGDAANTVKWLKETVDTGMPNYTLFSRDPHLDKIRKDPAFAQFMVELKLRFEKYQQEFR
jgi:tetratricopeptide (TPR) repeat protein